MDWRLAHDAVVYPLQPVIEPPMGFRSKVQIEFFLFNPAMVEGSHKETLGHREIGIEDEHVAGKEVIPACDQICRGRGEATETPLFVGRIRSYASFVQFASLR
ncbi:MAG: hypothetical protein COZ70_02260 [Deltaproteobacteria bacterium CG_4_8_14_3_um_filter_51_11]|nr:MAG: hypothetical protein AUK25_03815 [Desulfobacteraceae bacterium CG2_30_51_40]PIP46228.1 MAG: hypothetical protein COX16_09615 [Deltaproteobacteria bacterium CG23_combo_of_CG06-09_8_20_14_all_51_20]PIX20701.1 MAG: hypothetical protein COZ70_02260 [Deltaproteobacteria bacterium CG_4_8_14_3_um_filter_51_11]PIY23775.1 MAG: hypothetical protein COZ11_08930 [Deltaproteobacteria bacterium CG_4_10_14_3_um_filter_51_14]PJB37070.1 MAG: hypothetical protein CO107_05910 [Deltaproteobacteria bacteriu